MNEWIPIKRRPLSEEEKAAFKQEEGDIITSHMPEEDEEVLISVGDAVYVDTFCHEGQDGWFFEYSDINEVAAWMPLPKPYNKHTNPRLPLLAMAASIIEVFGDVYLELSKRARNNPGCQIAIDECVEMIENALKEAENAWKEEKACN